MQRPLTTQLCSHNDGASCKEQSSSEGAERLHFDDCGHLTAMRAHNSQRQTRSLIKQIITAKARTALAVCVAKLASRAVCTFQSVQYTAHTARHYRKPQPHPSTTHHALPSGLPQNPSQPSEPHSRYLQSGVQPATQGRTHAVTPASSRRHPQQTTPQAKTVRTDLFVCAVRALLAHALSARGAAVPATAVLPAVLVSARWCAA